MTFVHLWISGFSHPVRFIDELGECPAPHWGFYAVLARSLMDGLLLYLPLYWMGRVPPLRSYLSFIPTEKYYLALVWISPLVFLAFWLFGGGFIHVALRLSGRHSDYDLVLNLSGMVSLVIGTVIMIWDWIWILFGGMDQYWWGVSHLVIDIGAIALTTLGLKRLFDVPVWLGALLNLLVLPLWLPLGIMFMRSPV